MSKPDNFRPIPPLTHAPENEGDVTGERFAFARELLRPLVARQPAAAERVPDPSGAEAMREAAAKVADDQREYAMANLRIQHRPAHYAGYREGAIDIAAAIRALPLPAADPSYVRVPREQLRVWVSAAFAHWIEACGDSDEGEPTPPHIAEMTAMLPAAPTNGDA